MARISKALVSERKDAVLTAFRETPEPSVREVNDALFGKYGKRMGLKDIYALREQVREEKRVAAEAAKEGVTGEVAETDAA